MKTGQNILELRQSRKTSREEMAANLNIPTEELCAIEEGREICSVSMLLKIASILETDISALIYGHGFEEKTYTITHKQDRIKVERRTFFDFESLAPMFAGRAMEPFIVDVYPAPPEGPEISVHHGQEFLYIMEGTLRLNIDGEEKILEQGDSAYYDSSLPHSLDSITPSVKIIAVVYNKEGMIHKTRSKQMRNLIQGAKHLGGRDIVIVIPNETSLEAVNKGIEEKVIKKAFLVGDRSTLPAHLLIHNDHYEFVQIPGDSDDYEPACASKAVSLIREQKGQLIMKGKINTAVFLKAILNRETGIGTGRRLSLVSLFELPNVNRLVFLTDPGINPALTQGEDLESSKDIIHNAIDVAKGIGVHHPKVAILDANELPSAKVPSSLFAQQLTEMQWPGADVFGPLSYDLALYPESVEHKGIQGNPVAGKADVLIVPYISGGNFLYKAWAMTMSAEVANVVLGAQVPIILTSRSDSDMTKFLTICASAVYSDYLAAEQNRT